MTSLTSLIVPSISDFFCFDSVCRPAKLTCRWVREITKAVSIVCPSMPPAPCDRNPKAAWSSYLNQLEQSKCWKDPTVQQILKFEIDYNTILSRRMP